MATATEILNLFNPFDTALHEGGYADESRSLKTTAKEKFQDTYQVFRGGEAFTNLPDRPGFYNDERNPNDRLVIFPTNRAGILDYLTLGVFRLIHLVAMLTIMATLTLLAKAFGDNNEKSKSLPIRIIAATAGIVLTVPAIAFLALHFVANGFIRPALAVAATIVCTPFVLAAHAITSTIRNFMAKSIAKNIQVKDPSEEDPSNNQRSTYSSLYDVLASAGQSAADVTVELDNLNDKENSDLTIRYHTKNHEEVSITVNGKDKNQALAIEGLALVNSSAYTELCGTGIRPRHR